MNAAVKTIAKPAAKKTNAFDVAKPKAVTKPAAKKAPAKTTAKKTSAAKDTITHIVTAYARPGAGNRLIAFTAAWLKASGLQDGGTVPREKLLEVAGATAINYHTNKGNFGFTPDGMELTAQGLNFFGARTVDPQMRDGYIDAFHGKNNPVLKMQDNCIKPLAKA